MKSSYFKVHAETLHTFTTAVFWIHFLTIISPFKSIPMISDLSVLSLSSTTWISFSGFFLGRQSFISTVFGPSFPFTGATWKAIVELSICLQWRAFTSYSIHSANKMQTDCNQNSTKNLHISLLHNIMLKLFGIFHVNTWQIMIIYKDFYEMNVVRIFFLIFRANAFIFNFVYQIIPLTPYIDFL